MNAVATAVSVAGCNAAGCPLASVVAPSSAIVKTNPSLDGFPLSSGQAVRLVLARALVVRPQALLIDGLLDRLSDYDIADILTRLEKYEGQTTMVIATGRQTIAQWSDQSLELSPND